MASNLRNHCKEEACVFLSNGSELVGVVHKPSNGPPPVVGIVFIVGGQQFRSGAHRHFLEMARDIASQGYAAIRFDLSGTGDSSGEIREHTEFSEDISAAIDLIREKVPSIDSICLLGLCDGATAAMLSTRISDHVDKLILLNPWIDGEETRAQALVKHYYWSRLFNKVFWQRLISGKVQVIDAMQSWWKVFIESRSNFKNTSYKNSIDPIQELLEFPGTSLVVISDQDITGRKFEVALKAKIGHKCSDKMLIQVVEANHTFSNSASKSMLMKIILNWLSSKSGSKILSPFI